MLGTNCTCIFGTASPQLLLYMARFRKQSPWALGDASTEMVYLCTALEHYFRYRASPGSCLQTKEDPWYSRWIRWPISLSEPFRTSAIFQSRHFPLDANSRMRRFGRSANGHIRWSWDKDRRKRTPDVHKERVKVWSSCHDRVLLGVLFFATHDGARLAVCTKELVSRYCVPSHFPFLRTLTLKKRCLHGIIASKRVRPRVVLVVGVYIIIFVEVIRLLRAERTVRWKPHEKRKQKK